MLGSSEKSEEKAETLCGRKNQRGKKLKDDLPTQGLWYLYYLAPDTRSVSGA